MKPGADCISVPVFLEYPNAGKLIFLKVQEFSFIDNKFHQTYN